MVAVAGVALGTVVALATLLPFDSALGAPGLPAGPAWIYVTAAASAALLTVVTAWLSAWRYRTS
jgi:putative ABC transport system permease protein